MCLEERRKRHVGDMVGGGGGQARGGMRRWGMWRVGMSRWGLWRVGDEQVWRVESGE